MLESHYNAVTCLAFSTDRETLVSSGSNQICTIWELSTGEVKRTIPVDESIESIIVLPEGVHFLPLNVKNFDLHFFTTGSKDILRMWNTSTGTCVDEIFTISAEHNIVFYNVRTRQLRKQFAGYDGEVLDICFLGPGDSHIVVATNSPQLKVFELVMSDCQILCSHTDTVLALDFFPKGKLFVSGSKDKSFRVWRMKKTCWVVCVARGLGHAEGVGAIACSRMKESFLVMASQDCTIKV
ncbi:UNVERIFIED_CONTAM: hypothetical protein K2H54_004545 [Gekko kuhli]